MKAVDRQLLVACGQIPCAWQTEGTVASCPYLSRSDGHEASFPKHVCTLYSTPGPHAESTIATTLGVSVSMVRKLQATAMEKLAHRMAGDVSLGHDDQYVLLMERFFGE